jgi:hypothetical protein
VSIPTRRSDKAACVNVEVRAASLFSYFAIFGGITADVHCLTIVVAFASETTAFRSPLSGIATETKMKKIFAAALPILALSAGVGMASVNTATAQGFPVGSAQRFTACFQGDTMQRDGGRGGDLGAPKCSENALTPYDANAVAAYPGDPRAQ